MLALRVGHRTPTGIGRVELAYARHLLECHPESVRFLVALPRMVQIIPTRIAAKYIAATDGAWRHEDQGSPSPGNDVAAFLNFDPRTFAGQPKGETRWRRKDRFLSAANMLMRAALHRVRPRGLSQYSNALHRSIYVNVSGSSLNNPWLTKWLQRSPSVSAVFLVHDIIPITHPEYVRPNAPKRHARYLEKLSFCADALITNSDFTREELTGYFSREKLRAPMMLSVPLGIDTSFSEPHPPSDIATPYFVFVSTIEPRKNHLMLLQVWRRLVERHGTAAPKLLLVGARGWENENILDVIDRGDRLRGHVFECKNLSDSALAALIAGARATLLPSHVEGFGLPLAESLSLGTPVICSDLRPYFEIAGDIPEYIDPLAGRGWARTVMDYADKENPRRLKQLERLKSFRAPSWMQHFLAFERVVRHLGFTEMNEPLGQPVGARKAATEEPFNIAAE
jgi:glycosyltransferase involved in cell wall biosynthesis